MDQKRTMVASMKQKLGNFFGSQNLLNSQSNNSSSSKLPPRLQFKGMSIAARVVGHEIREFTYRNTGKDLAKLRENKTRNNILLNLSKIKSTLTNNEAKYKFLLLACNHNSNFVSSLTPEGAEYLTDDTDFEKNSLHEFISQYYKNCLLQENDGKSPKTKRSKPYTKHKPTKSGPLNDNSKPINASLYCRCNNVLTSNTTEVSFLNCWYHKGIKEEHLDVYCNENVEFFESPDRKDTSKLDDEWREFIRNEKCLVFRKQLENGIYEYRVQATFFDISANHLFKTQIDGEYRKKWDEYIVDFKVVDRDDYSNTELIHWVTKCPYPFATREYIYLRRQKIDEEKRMMVLYQQATDETNIPVDQSIQRVETYLSKIIIKPHQEDFNVNGCDFVLTYFDDPKMMLPRRILDMAASKGIKDSVDRMHQAALGLS